MLASRFKIIGIAFALAAPSPASAIIRGEPFSGATPEAAMVLNDRGGLCTGFFIDTDVLLTAAHCVDKTQVRVMIDGALVTPSQIARHPQFRAGAIASRQPSIDLALLRLTSVSGNAGQLSAGSPPAPGEKIEAYGFGLTREGDARSTGQYHRVRLTVSAPYGVGKLLVWAQNSEGGGGCQGDSGGPILNRDGTIIAVISWSTGHRGQQCGHYTQGILLAPHRAWIDSTLRTWGAAARWR